ncbi:hypothetical protein FE333_01455 [Dolosigranulum pigrum]|nr:hypothetical protein FE333_01455 [Dolosigranulum pigrum]
MQDIEPPYTEPYVRWCERSTSQLMASLLLDLKSKIERLISGQLPETSHSITCLIITIQNSNFWGHIII